MATETKTFLDQLISSGIQYGHQDSRWCPKMAPYIWGKKSRIHLINVKKTEIALIKAAEFLESVTANGQVVLLVGTKNAAKDAIESVAKELGMPYVSHRWIGGTLSNFGQVKKSVTKMLHYEDVLAKAEKYPYYTKKELNVIQKAYDRLQKNVGGIRNLTWPIGAIVLIDVNKERSALKEAAHNIPVVALVDTNSDPSLVDYVVPGNDDAPRAIQLVLNYFKEAIAKGLARAKTKVTESYSSEAPATEERLDIALMEAEVEEEENENKRRTAKKIGENVLGAGKLGIKKPRRSNFEEENRGQHGNRGSFRPRSEIKTKKD